ncbi:endonuclease/exonuclease/phosphatase family protein [Pseudobacter ginsenosidimutans]|uniref:Endonuclease/exonuclease/phosphatase family metal-dependent hydrolase n=1 Tax=Pseudobacter ginsenosidimutans TaxID=661488 RepID=A0A4Q7MS21_9BACT|nr:endonuclease/exonuclease/phosphatase family protein [Pseudobacter ginsenosidimutans]QEC41624.1 endonuclease/exonuclease/phosphatase family protein [Pseudobacter ginsenosidimutans]RZS71582.1 endonuclease/exonuclease/phosphatase family metal-dependent hydrolase [Pseudobacter ginsenosidimutans]
MAIRTFARRFFIVSNVITVAVFLMACANVFLHPDKWWFIAILGLTFPFLLLLTLIFLVGWSLVRSRWIFLSLGALVLGYSNIRALVGFHFASGFQEAKKENTIRILTWNVKWFDEQTRENGRESHRREMLEFIRNENADVLCFQEYFEPGPLGPYSNYKEIRKMGYPYFYRVIDYGKEGAKTEMGSAIFSKYPILDSSRTIFKGPPRLRGAESLISCDLDVNGQTIRVFTTHLQSVLLQKKDYRDISIIRNAEDSIVEASRSLIRKLRMAYSQRGNQVDIVRNKLDSCPHPEIICGDFNDVPNSYTYFRIRGNRRDAFMEKEGGLGRTFSNISPTLRIDYIMPDKQFEVVQYKRKLLPYSDHYPVIADLRLGSGK